MRKAWVEVDFIEELRLRSWARQHYVPSGLRDEAWHPVILEEMDRKEKEIRQRPASASERS